MKLSELITNLQVAAKNIDENSEGYVYDPVTDTRVQITGFDITYDCRKGHSDSFEIMIGTDWRIR